MKARKFFVGRAIGLLVVIIVGSIGWYFFGDNIRNKPDSEGANLGTYAYECDEHVQFTITPSSDLQTIAIAPVGGSYPPAATLSHKPTNTGARFEGESVVFVAHGETIILGEGDSAIACSPVPSSTEAPFNFGD